jgi:hypothetical protein
LITPTALGINASAVDNVGDIITFPSAHGLVTGQSVQLAGTTWAALPVGQAYYIRALSTTTIAFYNTVADAKANTNRVDITGSTLTAATLRYLVFSQVFSSGDFDSVSPIGMSPGSPTMGFDLNLSTPLAAALGTFFATAFNLYNSTPVQVGRQMIMAPKPSTWFTSTSLVQTGAPAFADANTAGNSGLNGTWAQQGTNPYYLQFEIRG